jgi:RNA polymerase sigma-32 factor
MAVNSLSVMSPDGGLSRYLTEIRKFPMLPKDEEFMLAQRWKEHQDSAAAHKMVTSTCASWPRSPWAIAATACRSAK